MKYTPNLLQYGYTLFLLREIFGLKSTKVQFPWAGSFYIGRQNPGTWRSSVSGSTQTYIPVLFLPSLWLTETHSSTLWKCKRETLSSFPQTWDLDLLFLSPPLPVSLETVVRTTYYFISNKRESVRPKNNGKGIRSHFEMMKESEHNRGGSEHNRALPV